MQKFKFSPTVFVLPMVLLAVLAIYGNLVSTAIGDFLVAFLPTIQQVAEQTAPEDPQQTKSPNVNASVTSPTAQIRLPELASNDNQDSGHAVEREAVGKARVQTAKSERGLSTAVKFVQKVSTQDDASAALPGPTPLRPKLKLDEYQDWRQAGNGADALGTQLRSHTVSLNRDGSLAGRISTIDPVSGNSIPVQNMMVHFVRNNQIVERVRPQANGEFVARGLKPGVYAIIGAGPGGFLAISIHVAAPTAGDATQANVIAMDMQAVPLGDMRAITELIKTRVPTNSNAIDLIKPSTNGTPGNGEMEQIAAPDRVAETTIRRHQVVLQSNGDLIGRMRRLHSQSGRPLRVHGMSIFLIQDNRIVASERIDRSGTFQLQNIKPGVYSLATAGEDEFAAFSMEAVAPSVKAAYKPVAGLMFVSMPQPAGDLQIDGATVGQENVNAFNSIMSQQMPMGVNVNAPPTSVTSPYTPPPSGGGSVGGGSVGGGSGFVAFGASLATALGVAAAKATKTIRILFDIPEPTPNSPIRRRPGKYDVQMPELITGGLG